MKWYYGNIASSTKILTLSRVGGPISMIQWQLKRFNLRLASHASASEGSLRLLCDACNKFQCLTPKNDPHLALQGCSMCLSKMSLVDTSLLVSYFDKFDNLYLNFKFHSQIQSFLRDLMVHMVYLAAN